LSEPFMYQPGQNVLCCMLLHSGKPDLPVYLSVDRASCFQRLFRIMDDFPVFLLCIRHPVPGKPSDISILPSAFRKEGGTVQNYFISIPAGCFLAGTNRCSKGFCIDILIIQSFCHSPTSFPALQIQADRWRSPESSLPDQAVRYIPASFLHPPHQGFCYHGRNG